VIYAAFAVYLLGILFMALGIYRLWVGMVNPRVVGWALLPGTIVSEMAYIFGCLITGAEVRRAKLMGGAPTAGRKAKDAPDTAQADPTAEAAPKLPYIGPVVAAFVVLLACGAGVLVAHALLGEPVMNKFQLAANQLPKRLPTRTGAFWALLTRQVELLRYMSGTWTTLDWLDWRVPVFVYLSACLTIRLAPVRGRSLRATLGAVVTLAAIIALVGLVWWRFHGLMGNRLWPLLSYVWASLLFLLSVSLIVRGSAGLVRSLLHKQPPVKS